MNLYDWFERAWRDAGGRVFLRELHRSREYSYAEVERITAGVAEQLVSRHGLRPGDRLAAQIEKSPEGYLLYLACLRAGGVFLPLNTAYTDAEVEYFVRDAEPRMLVKSLEGFDFSSGRFETVARAPSDLAAILYTSGTTGRSKGAMLTHENLRSNAEALARAWGFTREDRLLHALPTFHVHGLFISLHCVLATGATALWLPRFDAAEALRHLPEASVFMGVPTYYTRLLEQPGLDRARCSGVRLFVSGSAPLLAETFERFADRTGHRVLERYGMTETGVIASNPLQGERRPGTVGPALPGVEARVREGMIEVGGPNVFAGYWKKPGKTREEFTVDGFFRTGDLGSLDGQGYLTISGRAKDLVISGGFNVYPKEIEQVLDALPGVRESAVFGVPHPDFGEAVVAAVVPAGGTEPADTELIDEILRAVLRQVAAFKAPKRVFVLPELPRNTMGKVQKALLRERFGGVFTT